MLLLRQKVWVPAFAGTSGENNRFDLIGTSHSGMRQREMPNPAMLVERI